MVCSSINNLPLYLLSKIFEMNFIFCHFLHKVIPQPFPSIITHTHEFFLWPCRQVKNGMHTKFWWPYVSQHEQFVCEFHDILSSLKLLKCFNKKFRPCICRNVLEILCVLLYTEFLSELHEHFQVAFTCDTNIEYQI